MRVLHSPPNTLLDLDKETNPLPLFSGDFLFDPDSVYAPGTSDKGSARSNGWKATTMTERVPGGVGCGPLEAPQLAGLTGIPVSASPDVHSSTLPPTVGYVPTHSDCMTPFLAPESYLSDQRESPVSDALGSLYAWSSASGQDNLRPPASVDHSVSSATSSPFMQSYYSFGPSPPSVPAQLPGVSGYTAQQIGKWCIESEPAGSFYQSPAHYPVMSPLAFPSTEMSPNPYPPLNETIHTTSEQWFSMPACADPPSTSPAAGPAPETFLSPPSAAAVSIESTPAMSTSPAPTLSDFESSFSRRRPSSPSSNPADLRRYGIPTADGAWRCAHPGCTSQALFRRGCDLRKHFNRHRKHLFCRHEGCPQSRQGGFSSKKDRARHEAKHNPGIVCEWNSCGRVFSRVDNMKDHVRRIHRRGANS
ncbi:uncharacterized protein N7459_007828 [Penicillium hispanicum]|uniref:uncharacterized protein n=1 Tax=Penicillium hispanicum TaxID=1080232 RepID=UPI0025424DE3|nr:uncharacterized protein N7459_007828 [Penicillium hispanicum]KAJ5573401.1 hypothetical protein N7459_007828 [Penicillium hispanicum]